MIKYKAERHWGKITKVEIEKETAKTIIINGRRYNKYSDYESYFDTWEEAKGYLFKQAQTKVDSLRNQLERAKSYLGNIKGMKEEK